MKRFLALLLTGIMALSLVACGGDTAEDPAAGGEETSGEAACEPLTINMYNAVAGQTVDETLIPKTIELLEEYSGGAITVNLIPPVPWALRKRLFSFCRWAISICCPYPSTAWTSAPRMSM